MYLALEHKPDNGGESQNLADVALGIMLHLKVVKSANKEKAITASAATDAIAAASAAAAAAAAAAADIAAADEAGKGTQVLLELQSRGIILVASSPPTLTLLPWRWRWQ